MDSIGITISLGEATPARLDEVADAVRAAGMRITRRLDGIGILVGTVPRDRLASVRASAGGGLVEEDRWVGHRG